jgi:hypothetical protein
MNSSAPFNAAAKHLFRHLHDARALRKNPLVQRFFEESDAARLTRPQKEQAVLNRIHDLVRQGAEHCRDADLVTGNAERARRQHAIIIEQCLERRPIRDVALALGISYHHCYRERAQICKRVARYIFDQVNNSALDYLAELDGFQLLIHRVVRETAAGDGKASMDECRELIKLATTVEHRVDALCLGASVAMVFDDFQQAVEWISAAQQLYKEHADASFSPSAEVARARIEKVESKLLFCRGVASRALALSQRALRRLESVQSNQPPHVKDLYSDTLYDLGCGFWNQGRLEDGYDYMARAEASLSRLRATPSQLRSQITVGVWKLRNGLVMSSKTWYPASERLGGLSDAFEDAYASGWFAQALEAVLALMECHAHAEHRLEALQAARVATSLAEQQQNESIQMQTSIEIAAKLVSTPYWREGLGFLPDTRRIHVYKTFYRAHLAYFVAARALRLGKFADAWQLANEPIDYKANTAPSLRRQLVAAAAAYELGLHAEARTLIEALLPEAERLGGAPLLRDVCSVAAKVTGSRRFRRRSNELARLLTT